MVIPRDALEEDNSIAKEDSKERAREASRHRSLGA